MTTHMQDLTEGQWEPIDNARGNWGHAGRPGHRGGSAPRGAPRVGAKVVSIVNEPVVNPKNVARLHEPDVEHDSTGNGITDAARVGVPGEHVPEKVGQLPNLTHHERAIEKKFIADYEKDPDLAAENFRRIVHATTKPGEPPAFGTDDAKTLNAAWNHVSPNVRSRNRATLNLALHQTANAIAKRAFLKELNTLRPGDEIMVTVGGCGAGKGYAISSINKETGKPNVPQAAALKARSKVVWDSAGDQNATENPWIQHEAEKRGLKVHYVYVHADPYSQWGDPTKGVIKRASDPRDGRMVDAHVFADSYTLGARNFQAFYKAHRNNPHATFTFIDNTGTTPKLLKGIPKKDLRLDRHHLADHAVRVVEEHPHAPPHVKRGALIGRRIWKRSLGRK